MHWGLTIYYVHCLVRVLPSYDPQEVPNAFECPLAAQSAHLWHPLEAQRPRDLPIQFRFTSDSIQIQFTLEVPMSIL
ncbi:hypothetical protein ACN38_g9179 [Penicillium nordicum]|uniref:Uncharacterized protein n=1 Tax=Penicillium nordicum TaxID=229535 RepID=A0A0M9WCU2_9EURO|nr:hypothetical protein ACN38_g9179 [Penicillium nordicum]